MPRLTRRVAVRGAFATAGTVVAALVARKLIVPPHAEPVIAMPRLQMLAGLRPVVPPTALPPFTWQGFDPDGKPHPRSIADHAGQGVVLNIWATWCDPCTREMPSLARLADAVRADGIAVLPVSIDRAGAAAVRAFFAAHAIGGLPVLIDPTSSAMTSLGVGGVPTTFLVGRDGRLRGRFEGAADWNTPDAIAAVRRLLG